MLLREMARVARLGVVVNDLDRTRLGWIGAWLIGHLLTGNRYTRYDAPLSVLRAYRRGRDQGAAAERRPDAGADDPRLVRPALRDRGGADAPGRARTGRRRRIHRGPASDRERGARATAPSSGSRSRSSAAARPGRSWPPDSRAAGREVVVLERSPAWSWRAGGVFTSPAAVAALRRAGLDPTTLAAVARPIPAMRVETRSGTTFRLTYGTETGGEPAVGFDRSRLDPALLDLAVNAGADVRRGWHVTDFDTRTGDLAARDPDGRPTTIRASVVVGADGPHSVVARGAGVARPARLDPRVGLTYHLPDPDPDACRDARMRVLRDGYVGIAPVAGGRVNVGIVLGPVVAIGARATRAHGPSRTRSSPPSRRPTTTRRRGATARRRTRSPAPGRSATGSRAGPGPGWLLVGDAAGFLDPFTGEGLHRALVSAELAAAAIAAHRRGRARRVRRVRSRDAAPLPRQGRRVVARPGVPRPAGPVRVRGASGRRASDGPCDDGPRDG